MPLIVRSSHASMLLSWGFGAGGGAAGVLVVAAGLILMRGAGLDSVFPSVCDRKSAVCGDCVRGCGERAWGATGFGDEAPEADGEPEASGAVDEGREMDGPPSLARRLARICARLSSACLLGRELSGSCTLSASDMALSCSDTCSGG